MAYSKDEVITIARTFIDRIKAEYPIDVPIFLAPTLPDEIWSTRISTWH